MLQSSAMNMSTLLTSLNPPQKEAVSLSSTHILVLAGAGSGKTRVLAHRMVWLIQEAKVDPHNILAVTFTNKAAQEMRERIGSLLSYPVTRLWIGTFHGLAHRLLRLHAEAANLPDSFQIIDTDDQYRLIRRILRHFNLAEEKWPPKQILWFINQQKEQGLRAHQVRAENTQASLDTAIRVYEYYETRCQQNGVVDFPELLLRLLELLQKNSDLREHYQQKFQHILVDEFQDTNNIQYNWLKILYQPNNCIMAVGDDDQSIYSWRGANIENIQRFTHDFRPVKTIRLEQNYRSTQTILKAANALIAHNQNRMGKELWTEGNEGDPIILYNAVNERDEAHYIVANIQAWFAQGRQYTDVAILYRSNAQSRILEERLLDRHIPYRIYGGMKFFERAEIKDALAYLRLIANRQDDGALERIINVPTRGIGDTTLSQLQTWARLQSCTLWSAATQAMDNPQHFSPKAASSLHHFMTLINQLDTETTDLSLGEQTKQILAKSGLVNFYKKDKSEKGLSKLDNLEEFITATTQFIPNSELDLTPLSAFLSHIALETGEASSTPQQTDCVHLMTLHAAKGLEFPLVCITGLEEYLFPHRMSSETPKGLEEERRLFYVGMTRAMEKLILTHANSRTLYGKERYTHPSRFIAEIPTSLLDIVSTDRTTSPLRIKSQYQKHGPSTTISSTNKLITDTPYSIGQRVRHQKFGLGTITNYEGRSEHVRLHIRFEKYGEKWLVASYAKLEALT